MSTAGTENSVLEAALRDFKRSVEITRDVRFQANLRLAKRQTASSYIVSILSLYVVALSLLPNIILLKQYQNQILLACSIVLSIFIIFTSLLDASQNFFHKGELLHSCARKVATINHDLKSIDIRADPARAREMLAGLQKKYQEALDECPTNHENVDFRRQKANKPHLFPKEFDIVEGEERSFRQSARRWYFIITSFIFSHIWMSMHLGALCAISWIVYRYVLAGAEAMDAK